MLCAAGNVYQWQQGHEKFTRDALVKLCRMMVRECVNHERNAKGEPDLPLNTAAMYRSENKPDWWPFQDWCAKSFANKDQAVQVYNAARKVLAAIHDVNLEAAGGGGKE